VNVELINTGSELMLGRVLNTHQQWLCRRLADLGYIVTRQVAVADTGRDIETVVREALSRADLIITTGGLGPTSDDITRDLIAGLLGKKLHEDATIVRHIEEYFLARKRPMPFRTRVQAQVPEGAIVLPNPHGTAPGLAIEVTNELELKPQDGGMHSLKSSRFHPSSSLSKKLLIMLPGPPRELRPMFDSSVLPLLQRVMPLSGGYNCRTLRTSGIGESAVEEKVGALLKPLVDQGLDLGYCARIGQVDIRLAAHEKRGLLLIQEGEAIVRTQLADYIYGEDDEPLESVIVRLLRERRKTLALAESCTGGGIAHLITNVPGASAVLLASLVTYANSAKQKFVGVRAETLATHGAVSEAVACEMAEGARRETGADYALSVTGIAGPGGGSDAKPVGTVFIALASASETVVLKQFNAFDRETFKNVTGTQVMELLRRKIR
jgi:nicotinamide-nucleotide amidase